MSSTDELISRVNPVTIDPSVEEVDRALARIASRLEEAGPEHFGARDGRSAAGRRGGPRVGVGRRTGLRIAAVGGLAAAGLAAVSLAPSGHHGGVVSEAWAKTVLAKTRAALTDQGSGILHVIIDEQDTVPNANGDQVTHSLTIEDWSDESSDDYWAKETLAPGGGQSTDTAWTVNTPDSTTIYDADSNLIRTFTNSAHVKIEHPEFSDPAAQQLAAYVDQATIDLAAANLPKSVIVNPGSGQVSVPGPLQRVSFAGLLRQLISSNDATVQGPITQNGHSEIQIDTQNGVTVYVDPQTYAPLELDFNGTPRTGSSVPTVASTTLTFQTYETLPADSVTPPDLQQLYPNATVVDATPGASPTGR